MRVEINTLGRDAVAAGSGRYEVMELDREELDILVDLLETRVADIRMEIGRMSGSDSRDMLRKKKKVLEKALERLRGERFSSNIRDPAMIP